MTTFNGARHLGEQLRSIEDQLLKPFELHIGDDGSTDTTPEIIAKFADSCSFPVHFHRNEHNLGFGDNFIATARRCSGNWIAFCDQDDVWLPHKLEACAAMIRTSGDDLSLVAHNVSMVDQDRNPLRELYDYPGRAVLKPRTLQPDWLCVGFSQVIRAELILDVKSSPRPTIPWHSHREPHDVWSAVLANAVGRIGLIGEPLALYRRHEETVTSIPDQIDRVGSALAVLRNNGASYAKRGSYVAILADHLRKNSLGADPRLAASMHSAASLADRFSINLLNRSAVYLEGTWLRRLKAFLGLIGAGAYVGRGAWPFGVRALAKDGLHLIIPRRRDMT